MMAFFPNQYDNFRHIIGSNMFRRNTSGADCVLFQCVRGCMVSQLTADLSEVVFIGRDSQSISLFTFFIGNPLAGNLVRANVNNCISRKI